MAGLGNTGTQLILPGCSVVECSEIDLTRANELLSRWGHYLGPIHRPFGAQAFVMKTVGEPVAVAVSASTVSTMVAGYKRGEVVELARMCVAPEERWATRVMLRLWREVFALAWSAYWIPKAAVAYSQNLRHDGNVYRFDGWQKITDQAGSSGGGTWSNKRNATDAVHGKKTLWLWRYG